MSAPEDGARLALSAFTRFCGRLVIYASAPRPLSTRRCQPAVISTSRNGRRMISRRHESASSLRPRRTLFGVCSRVSCAVGRLSTLASAGPTSLHTAYNFNYIQAFLNNVSTRSRLAAYSLQILSIYRHRLLIHSFDDFQRLFVWFL